MDLNHVTLTGALERDPLTRCADHGTLRVDEPGPAGDQAGALTAGAAGLVAGKLKWTSYTDKQGQQRTSLCVLARRVKRLAPAPVEAGV